MAKYALALVLIVMLIVAVAYRMVSISRLAPPGHVKHFDHFVVWNPSIDYYRMGATSEGPVLMAEAVGGPVYVFDRRGLLVEWTASTDPAFEKKWGATDKQLDRKAARAWFDEQRSSTAATAAPSKPIAQPAPSSDPSGKTKPSPTEPSRL
ncbi:MAG: hypothetical protein R3236_04935 [Phycisphaeraceae bacterium]|nr:hypothetical protein [Phycisphaeraceae bacterium]